MAEKQEDDKKSANQAPLENNMSSLASLSISSFLASLCTISTKSACIDTCVSKRVNSKV